MAEKVELSGLVDALTQVVVRVQRALDHAASEYGVPATQARLLRAVGDGAPTMSELAQRLALDKSSASGLVDRAEQRGLVRRVRSQLDRRSVRVRLTAQGRELESDVSALFADELVTLLEPLSREQLASLTGLLDGMLRD